MKRFVTLFVFALLAAPAFAQVPQDVPDGNGRDLGEEQEERRTEAYREELQHLYVSTQAGAGTSFRAARSATLGIHQAVGLEFSGGHIFSVALDAYRVPIPASQQTNPLNWIGLGNQTVTTVSVQYHHNLRALAPHSAYARRTTVALGAGVTGGGGGSGGTFTLTPTYTLPINRYWSMPVGVKLSHLLLDGGASVAQRTFLGLQVGVRLHPYGHRDRLE